MNLHSGINLLMKLSSHWLCANRHHRGFEYSDAPDMRSRQVLDVPEIAIPSIFVEAARWLNRGSVFLSPPTFSRQGGDSPKNRAVV